MSRVLFVLALGLCASGCATMSPERGHAELGALVHERVEHSTGWEQGPPPADAVRERVRSLLEDGLTREEAVRLALVNNPELQAAYEALGVSQAEMVEAGLLRNPVLGVSVGLPSVEFGPVQPLLDLFLLPARKAIARRQFEADVLRTAHEALAVVARTREAYTRVQAAEMLLRYQTQLVAVFAASAELARMQREAGNVAELDLALARAAWQESRVGLAREELAVVESREQLTRMLGLWGEDTEWTTSELLPEPPAEEPPLEGMEKLALRRRLDIDAARADVELLTRAVELAKGSRLLGTVEVGVNAAREADGLHVVGPSLVLELPVFNQRQALIGGLEARARQAERRLTQVAVEARSQVRVRRAEMQTARRLVEHYSKVLLPLRQRVVVQSQLQYNAMSLSAFQLLEARRDEVRTYREYVEALRDYWNAHNALENAVGGGLTETRGGTP